MSSREANEKKFGDWETISDGGRRYWLDVPGRNGWRARYVKIVTSEEVTVSFVQEIYNETGEMVEIHEKYPIDRGHRKL